MDFELLTCHKFFAMLCRLWVVIVLNICILKSSIMIFGPFIGIFKIRVFKNGIKRNCVLRGFIDCNKTLSFLCGIC